MGDPVVLERLETPRVAAQTTFAAPASRPSWLDRLLRQRDRLYASDAFQRWAGRFPLTRPIARVRSRALFDLCAGFVYSQVLQACVELDLFGLLAKEPLEPDEIARRVGVPADAARRLLGAGVALRLFERRTRGRIGLGALGAPLVNNEPLRALVAHHALLYDDLRRPVELLRGDASRETALGEYYPYAQARAELGSADVAGYSALMSATQTPLISELLDAVAFDRARRVLDVGGGEGRLARALAERWPDVAVTVFDLPAVAERARCATAAAGLNERVGAVAGDFRIDALPTGFDTIMLVRILLDHDDEAVCRILRRARTALGTGGRLVIAEPMAGERGAQAVGDAYFAFYLLSMGSGRARSATELGALCRAAGFWRVTRVPTRYPVSTGILVAEV